MKKGNQIAFLEAHLPYQLINQLPANWNVTKHKQLALMNSPST